MLVLQSVSSHGRLRMLNCFRIQVSSYLFELRGTRVQRDGSLIIQAKLINCVKSRGTHPEVDQCRSATN